MTMFRAFLVLMWLCITAYTVPVARDYGLNLFPYFFGDIARWNWAGQFNLDFLFMLSLSGLWTAWRHEFSGAGLALGLLAFLGGASFLSVYLLVLLGQSGGDLREVLLGKARAARKTAA